MEERELKPQTPARRKRKRKHDDLLIPDKAASEVIWRAAKGGTQGFSVAWDTKFKNKLVSQTDMLALDKVEPIELPHMFEKLVDRRLLEPSAYGINRTKDGWIVVQYVISGSYATIKEYSRAEPKSFAISRLNRLLQGEIL